MRKNRKKVQKMVAIMAITMAILLGMLVTENEAANETNTTTQNTEKQSSANTSNTATSQNKVTEKSGNANLSNLGIRPHDFTGFKYGTTSYEVSVPENTETVEVYATAQDAKAKITGTGKKTLEKGKNTVQVVVTAENGAQRTYTIQIMREVQQEEKQEEKSTEIKEETKEEEGKGLTELKINNLSLSPEFKSNVYEYTTKYIGEAEKLNIETKATDEDYVIEVVGNENLQEGENVITILVSEKNGENIATYQVTVNKSLVDEEAIAREAAEKKAKQQRMILGIAGAVALLIIIIVAIVIRKRNKNIAEEFSGIGFYGNDEEEDEMPKALMEESSEEEGQEDSEEVEEDFETMSKDKVKEKFLNGYTSRK